MAPLPPRHILLGPDMYIEKRYVSTQPQPNLPLLIRQVVTVTGPSSTSTITLSPGSTSTSSPQPNQQPISAAPTSSPSGPSNSVVVGAILGSFLGFVVLCIILYYCCIGVRWPFFVRGRRSNYSDSEYDSSRSSDSEISVSRVRVRRRGGGGAGWFGDGRRESDRVKVGVGMRMPERVTIRRERERRASYRAGSSSSGTTSERRRSRRASGAGSRTSRRRKPLFGWAIFGANSGGRSELRRDTWYGAGKLRFNVDD